MSVLKFRNPNYTEGGTEEKWITLQTGGGGIEDAPVDGNQYVRQDGSWAEVVIPEVDVQEAPVDGKQYARQDGSWTEVNVPSNTSELNNDSGFITEVPSEYVTETELTEKGYASTVSFTNLSASSWVSDSTYAAYPYRCDLTCSGVTADDFAEVVYGLNEAISGNYAPICSTSADVISIWSALNETITIPTIKIIR